MKKMKSFWKILLQREAFGILGGIIICLVLSSVAYAFFTEYEDNYYADEFESIQERVMDTVKDGPVSELYDKVSFRFAIDAEMKNGVNYIYMEDEETGKRVASSDRGAFIVLRDKNTEETAKVFRVDDKYMQPISSKYDDIDVHNRFYYLTGDLDLVYLPKITPEFYSIRIQSAYRGDGVAYPGTIEVISSSDILESEEKIIDTVTLAPENAEDYEYVEKSSDYTMLAIFVGNSHVPQIDSFSKETLNEPFEEGQDSINATLHDGFFWPGRGAFFGKFRFTDSTNKSYIVHYSAELYFKDLAMYVVGVNMLIMIIAIMVGFVGAKKQYNREKYQYSLIAYQNNLIDVMAHDLRTPLMAMSGYAENLKEENNLDKRDYYIDAILKNTDHMSQIISRNLELTKIGTEEIKRNYKKIELVGLLKESISGYQPLFDEKKVAINYDGTLEIKGDESLLITAFDNIASNMVKYVNEGGSIKIIAKGKVLKISNTTAEKLKNPSKLWEPFVRGDESRSNQSGTGLGLAIAKGVFNKHKLKSKIEVADGRFVVELKK